MQLGYKRVDNQAKPQVFDIYRHINLVQLGYKRLDKQALRQPNP